MRVLGIETEYALVLAPGLDKNQSISRIITAISEKYPHLRVNSMLGVERAGAVRENGGFFLLNSGRIYDDSGHLEWSTPETRTAWDAVLYEQAGEHILLEAIESLELAGQLIKNNLDYRQANVTFGCHENYSCLRRFGRFDNTQSKMHLNTCLEAFLISRQIFTGTGRLGAGNEQNHCSYQLAQRADFILHTSSGNTRDNRAIINERDESLDLADYRRLHLILGDSNISPFATLLKVGTTQIVLNMIEAGYIHHSEVPRFEKPLSSLKAISRDITFKNVYAMQDTSAQSFLSVLAVQDYYLQKAKAFIGKDSDDYYLVRLWEQTLQQLEASSRQLLGKVDWYSKHYLIQEVLKENASNWESYQAWEPIVDKVYRAEVAGSSVDSDTMKRNAVAAGLNASEVEKYRWLYEQLRLIDLRFHDVNPRTGLFFTLCKSLSDRREDYLLFDIESLEEAKFYPPLETRAQLRSELMAWVYEMGLEKTISLNWDRVNFEQGTYYIHNPLNHDFAAIKQDISHLIWPQSRTAPSSPGTTRPKAEIKILNEEIIENEDKKEDGNFFQKLFKKNKKK